MSTKVSNECGLGLARVVSVSTTHQLRTNWVFAAWVGYWGAENLEIAKTEGRGNDNNYCVAWSKESKDEFFDGAWKFGKAMGVLGAIICIPFILLSFYILVYKVRPVLFTAAIGAYISLAVISLLLLVGLSSDLCDVMSCQMGPGGYFAILSFFLWLGAAFMAFRLRGLSMDDRDDGDYGGESPHDGKPYPDEKRLALPPSENLSQKV